MLYSVQTTKLIFDGKKMRSIVKSYRTMYLQIISDTKCCGVVVLSEFFFSQDPTVLVVGLFYAFVTRCPTCGVRQ